MPKTKDIHRLALLLKGFGNEIAEPALARLDDDKAELVRKELESLAAAPPGQNELNEVLDDFDVFMRFALETAGAPTNWTDNFFDVTDEEYYDEDNEDSEGKPRRKHKLKLFQPSDDPLDDLQRLNPIQVAGALSHEHPKTIGLMLSSLDNAKSADVIALLPDKLQSQVFFALQNQQMVPNELLRRIAQKTVEKAALIVPAEVESRDDDQKTADLLRALPKETRNRLMAELEEADAETAARLQDLLYVFEDVVLYDNRSIQKLLGQCDTQVLVVALHDAEEAVSDRIFQNLSSRAATALKEEIEFSQAATPTEVETARGSIAGLICQLDKNGDLTELQ